MKNKSYFILSRDIFDSAIWRDDPHTLKLFLYLIGQARFDDKPKKYPDFEIKRGELVTSLSQIAENNEYMWHGALHRWSRQKVSRMLQTLIKQGYIKLLSDTYGTHITVCNYECYQNQQNYKRTEVEQKWNGSGTGVGIYKQDKQGKEKDIYTLFDFWNSCNIVKHRELEKYKSYIEKKLKSYPLEEIKKTIQNYRDILDSAQHYFSHKWSLDEFFSRKAGFDKFHDDNNPFSQWLNDKKQPKKYDEQSF